MPRFATAGHFQMPLQGVAIAAAMAAGFAVPAGARSPRHLPCAGVMPMMAQSITTAVAQAPNSEAPQSPSPAAAADVDSAAVCQVRVRGFDRTRPPGTKVEPGPAVVAGALTLTRVDVEFDGARLSSAIRALARAARVNVVALFRTSDLDPGLDGNAPVTLSLENVTAAEALEAILAAGTGMVDSTWQIRGNLIECGPKSMLAESSRRETRVYDISDLRFEIPRFSSDRFDPEGRLRLRRKPREASADLARLIVSTVEPAAWREVDPTEGAETSSSSNLDGESRSEIFVRGQWASLQIRNDEQLVVSAPGFIHRQIGGVGPIVPPAGEEERPRMRSTGGGGSGGASNPR